MRKLSLFLSLALLPLSTLPALADGVTITVTPWLAPNAFGSPSYAQAVQNQEYAISHGLTTYGGPGPTQYNAQLTPFLASQAIVTSFSSWMGVANPGGAYANELGNRMLFGIAILGNGTQFSISQLSFNSVSSDTYDELGFPFAAGHYTYSDDYEGVVYNADGSIKTVYNSSNKADNTTLVDAVFGRGSGSAYEPTCDDSSPNTCPTDQAGEQAAIDDAASYPGYPYTYTGTYMVGNATGSGTFTVLPDTISTSAVPTPEPSSLILLGTGVLGLAGAVRRRFRATS